MKLEYSKCVFSWPSSRLHILFHIPNLQALLSMQVVFGGDPEAALIQYTKNEEARRAISSTEAVLNNRFIRVYWHREPGANNTSLPQQEQSTGSQAAGSAPGQGPQHSNLHKVIMKIGTHLNLSCFHTDKLNLHLTAFLKPFLSYLPSYTGDQAAQSSRLCVEQDFTQASSPSNSWNHSYNQDRQPDFKHRRCHCTLQSQCHIW